MVNYINMIFFDGYNFRGENYPTPIIDMITENNHFFFVLHLWQLVFLIIL